MRTALLTGIFSHLTANPDDAFVLALGGAANDGADLRYWPNGAPQRAAYPYAVAMLVSDLDVGAITADISEIQWRMMIFTRTLSEGNALAASCKKLFNRQVLSCGTGCFICRYEGTLPSLRESDTDPFETPVTFSCYLEE
ncbi:DUF3168 domain-containing protein [Desulfovibrio sp. OttesenSCG-928-A18]|nr:DUF3168 domain-containing protein [Desulfovibrio sp. OttesenSCG-928-A18]